MERIKAVNKGRYSISWKESIPGYGYSARYGSEDGNIICDTFKSYSQPEITCVLQCLMSNHVDLHPIFIAEDGNLFWPIIWYFGSVYNAISSCCDASTLYKVYGNTLEGVSINAPTISFPNQIARAFPASASNQLRIACGNETCPQVDHHASFKKCGGCRVRYYCCKKCQVEDFKVHKSECKAERIRNDDEVSR